MPTFAEKLNARRNQTSGQQFNDVFQQIGPYTSGFSAPNEGQSVQQLNRPQAMASQNLFQKIGAVAGQTADIVGSTVKATGRFIAHSAEDIGLAAYGAGKTFVEMQTQTTENAVYAKMSEQLDIAQQNVVAAYKSGKMSRDDYVKALLDLSKANQDLSKETQKISQGPSPIKRAQDVAETAVNILSLGNWGLAEVGSKQALQAGLIKAGSSAVDKNAIAALAKEAATPLERFIMKVPAARSLIERNLTAEAKRQAEKLTGENFAQFLTREGKNIAVDLLIKRPVFYQSNLGGAKEIYEKILDGKYPQALQSAAWLGSQMIEGGPLGLASKGASWLKRTTGKLAYGTGSVIDELSKQIGNKKATQIADYLAKLEGKEGFKQAHGTNRIIQETNLRIAKEDALQAAKQITEHYTQNNIPLESVTPKMIADDFARWAKADHLAQKTLRSGLVKGISKEDAEKYVVVRWDSATKNAIANTIDAAGTEPAARLAALEKMASRPGAGWSNNDILMKRLRSIITSDSENAVKEIKAITTASTQLKDVPKRVSATLSSLGYSIARPAGGRKTPIVGIDETRKLITGAIHGDTNIFDPATAPQPVLKGIANIFEKAGLSPREAQTSATRKLSESIVATLDELDMSKNLGLKQGRNRDVVNGGQAILSKLQDYIEHKPGILGASKSAISDIRQLTNHEIAFALHVSPEEAKAISHAVMEGYAKVPMELRGLGDKAVDILYAKNPLQKYYSRVQSALRYVYNPFFRTQERVETKLLSHVQASNLVWNKSRGELNDAARLLDESHIFTSSLPGEAAQDQVLGRITANITQGQKRDMAGLALDMAAQRGLTLEQMVNQHADEIDDVLRVVVQYPRKGILASPLSRTLNLMFFPMRYNAKVTMLAANVLAKQPPSVQLAVIHSGFKMREWLKSDEGIHWQADHADAIQVFNWLTPINSIEATLNTLGHKPNSVADLGQLGGLPFGFISQILDSQGVIKLNKPYVNPKTGEAIPDYIPESVKARASVAIIDMLGSMFTYPGRTLGLPGKQASIRAIVKDFIATNGSDFSKRENTDRLTPLQQNMMRVLGGDTSKEAVDALYNAPAHDQFNWYTLPPLAVPEIPHVEVTSSGKKKAIARPIPRR